MAEEYKVLIGVEPKESDFSNLKDKIKDITDKEYSIKFKSDSSGIDLFNGLNISKQAQRVGEKIGNDLSKSVNKSLNVDEIIPENQIKKAKLSVEDLEDMLLNMKKVFTGLGNENIFKVLTSSIAQIPEGFRNVNAELKNVTDSIVDSIDKLKKTLNQKDFRLDLGLQEKISAGERNALFDQEALNVIPELRKQAVDLLSLFNVKAPMELGEFIKNNIGGNLALELREIQGLYDRAMSSFSDTGKSIDFKTQSKNIQEFMNKLREYAKLGGIDLTAFEKQFAPVQDMLNRLNDISSGAAERNSLDQRLKEIFKSDVNFTEITQSIGEVVGKIGELKTSIEGLSKNGVNLTGLTTNLKDISDSLGRIETVLNGLGGQVQIQQLSQSFVDLAEAIRVATNACTNIGSTMNNNSQAVSSMSNVVLDARDDADALGDAMEGLGIDQSDIDTAKQRLQDMDITILSVTKHIRDLAKGGKAIDFTITGVDQHGEKVTATQQYRQVKTKKGYKTVQYKDIKINQEVGKMTKPIDEVSEAYRRMLRIVSDMSSIRVDLIGLDPKENANEISVLTDILNDLGNEYQQLDSIFGQRLNANQVEGLNDAWDDLTNNIRVANAQMADTSALEQQKSSVQKLNSEIKELLSTSGKIGKLKVDIEKLKLDGDSDNEVAELERQLNDLIQTYQQLERALQGNLSTDQFKKLIKDSMEAENKIDRLIAKAKDKSLEKAKGIKDNESGFDNQYNGIEERFNKIKEKTDETSNAMDQFKTAYNNLQNAIKNGNEQEVIDANNKYQKALKEVDNQLKINARTQKQQIDLTKIEQERNKLIYDAKKWLRENDAAAKQFGDEIQDLISKLQKCDGTDLGNLKEELRDIKRRADEAGVATSSMWSRIKKKIGEHATYFSASSLFNYAEEALRSMYNNVVEVDSAMTNLYKVTDETATRYEKFLTSASKNAQGLGRSVSSFVEQTANWAKMGYSIGDSEELAKLSSIYANVADLDDATAVSDMVTAMKAFGIETSNAITIVDGLNKLSNEFAVTASGLGQGLSNAASTMATAGTDMEHTLALLTGISEITQSPEEAGNFLKVSVARIQGMKGALEELGEEVDESVDSISKVQTQILNLTGGKVNIFDNAGEFRDYYDIMNDIAGVVDELTSTDRASLYEVLFGKNRMNQGAAMIQAFQSGRIGEALDAVNESAGSAYAEQEKWMDSIEAKLGSLEAAWESLSNTVMDSDLVKFGIDFLTGFVNGLESVIDKIGALNTLVAGFGIYKFISTAVGMGGGISKLGDVVSVLEEAFPAAAKGVKAFTSSLSSGAKGTTLLTKGANLLKASLAGIGTVIKAHPILAIVTAIAGLVTVFYNASESAEELSQKVDEITTSYDNQKETLKNTKSTLNSIISDYEKLSKGVNDLGENVYLTEEEFGQYNDITNKIADMFPTLIQGYTDTGIAILKCKDNVELLTQAYNDQIIANNNSVLTNGRTIFDDFKNAQEDFEKSNLNNKEYTSYTNEALRNILYSEDLDTAIGKYAATGTTAMVQIVQALKDAGLEQDYGVIGNIFDNESGHDFIKRSIQENRTIVESIVGDFDSKIKEETKGMQSIAEAYVENALLNGDYAHISSSMYNIVNGIVSEMDYDFFSQFDTIDDLYKHLRGLLASFNVLDDDKEKDIELFLDIKTKFNNNDCTIDEYIQYANNVLNSISKFDEETQKSILISLGLENIDEVKSQRDSLVEWLKGRGISEEVASEFTSGLNSNDFSFELELSTKFSKDRIEAELNELQNGGSVDLFVRPIIDSSVLEDNGWENVGEGVATVFTSTFANEAENIAMNFTPIIVDENGNFVDVLSPNELQSYAEEVIAGTRKDDLGLQIGAKFVGEDAIKQAEMAAEYIHQLHYFYYNDASGYNVDDLYTEIEEYRNIVQPIEPISFPELMADKSFGEAIDIYLEKTGKINDALEKLRSGEFADSDFVELYKIFPELAVMSGDLSDNLLILHEELTGGVDELGNYTGVHKVFQDQFRRLNTEEDIAALDKYSKAVLEAGKIVGNTQYSITFATESEGIENLSKAMKESVSSTGLSAESIVALKERYKDLEGYDPSELFERSTNGIRLNTDAVNELEEAYEKQVKTKLENKLRNLRNAYDHLTDRINDTSDAATKADLYAQRNEIVDQIQDTADLASQYNALTSAYYKWQEAQSNGNARDMYESIIDGKKEMEEEMSRGFIDEDSMAYLEMMTDDDISTVEEAIDAYNKLYDAKNKAGYSVFDLFTVDKDGNVTAEGIDKFYDSILAEAEAVGQKFAYIDENGVKNFNFAEAFFNEDGIDYYGDEAVAKMLGIGKDAFHALLLASENAGYKVHFESDYTELYEYEKVIQELEESNKELSQEPVKINIYAEDVNSELANAQTEIQKIKDNDELTLEIRESLLAEAYAKVDALIARIEQPAFMSINVSDVDTSLQDALILLQNYQTSLNKLTALEIKGLDTTDAQTEVDNYIKELEGLDPEIKVSIGLEEKDTADTIAAKISNNEVNVSLNTDDTSDSVIDDQTVNVTVNIINGEDIKTLQEVSEYNGKTIQHTHNVTVNGAEELKEVQSALDESNKVNGKTLETTFVVTGAGVKEIKSIKTTADELDNEEILTEINAAISGDEEVKHFKVDVYDLDGKEVESKVWAITNGDEDVAGLKKMLQELDGSEVTTTINVVTKNIGEYGEQKAGGQEASMRPKQLAFASGTAYANGTSGKWGTKDSGIALGGEEGQELVVRDGRYFTIGDTSAEMFKYQRGDIIFNADQTRQILQNGKITAGRKRGKAFSNGSTSTGASVSIAGSVRTDSSSSSKSKAKEEADEFLETLDWIETAIDRIERSISTLDLKASSTYRSWSERNESLKGEIVDVAKEINIQQKAYERYLEEANSVGLSEEWAAKVRDGKIDIESITDEDLNEKISQYQEWYEKALDCRDAVEELNESLSELYETAFNNVSTKYEGLLSLIEHEKNMLEEFISQSEANGYIVSTKYYDALARNEQSVIKKLESQRQEMLNKLEEAMQSGTIEKGSEAWVNMCDEINQVTLAIEESNTAMLEYANSIREIEWEVFDLLQDRISQVTEEADFLIDLMSSDKLHDDKGRLTNEGLSTMGLHGQNYNTYMVQADKYAEEIKKLNEQIEDDPYDQELINRRQELLELQQDMILSAEDEKQAIVDLVEEGIELELESLQELIDEYTEALESQKDLYDYQKKVKEQTKEIASLEKQMAAYSGDNSEESRAKIQQLKVSLEEAKESLEETEYERYIQDQGKLLDELYTEYETILNMRLDDVDALISDMITEINNGSSIISTTLAENADSVGYTLSETITSTWDTSTEKITSVLTTYGQNIQNGISSAATTLNNALSAINTNILNMTTALNSSAGSDIESIGSSSAVNSTQANAVPIIVAPTPTPTPEKPVNTSTEKPIIVGGKINAAGAKIYDYAGSGSGERQLYRNDPIYTVLKEKNGWLQVRHHSLSKGVSGWFRKSDVKGYKLGKKDFLNDEVAWTQENGTEFIIRPSDGAILTPIAQNDSILNADASNNIWDMANDPTKFIRESLNAGGSVDNIPVTNSNNTYDNDFSIVFELPNVTNYEQLKYAMQHDKGFEKMIRSITVDRMFGGSSLKKYSN